VIGDLEAHIESILMINFWGYLEYGTQMTQIGRMTADLHDIRIHINAKALQLFCGDFDKAIA
jgi:hypothetical protein